MCADDAAHSSVRSAEALERGLEPGGVPLRRREEHRCEGRLDVAIVLLADGASERHVVLHLVRVVDRGVLLVRIGAQDLNRLAHVVVELGGLGLSELLISRRVVVVRHALTLEHRERDSLQVTVELIREPIDERLVILLLPRLLSRAHTPRVASA